MNYKKLPVLLILFFIFSCQEKKNVNDVSPGKNVILITLDGLRWQEVFSGADSSLISNTEYVDDSIELRDLFWRDGINERRKLLMPFFWSVIESKGILLGNRGFGNKVNLTNTHWFSYPGYNEILTGFADDRINSNDKINNPNETVLEFVNKQQGFENKVAAFGSWDVFPYIINEDRSGVYVNAGFEPVSGDNVTAKEELLNTLQEEIPRTWSTVRVDAFTHHYALEYLEKSKPRLLYIAYGETDDFAHDGSYDHYLKSAHQTDAFINEIWKMISTDPYYADKTSLVITTDHGRGTYPLETWKSHGSSINGADQTWIAAIGPGVRSLGELKVEQQTYQNQIAATVASLLELNLNAGSKAGPSIKEISE